MTPEEYEEFMSLLAEGGAQPLAPPVFRDSASTKSDVDLINAMADLREARAEEAGRQFSFQVAPTRPIEPGMRQQAVQRSLDELDQDLSVKARAGDVTSPVEADFLLSRYAGQGQVYNPETGALQDIDVSDPAELFRTALGRRAVAEATDVREAARRVRMDEATREDVNLPEGIDLDFDAPPGETAIYEDYGAVPFKALNVPEALFSETVFGRFPLADSLSLAAAYATRGASLKFSDREQLRKELPDPELLFFSVDEDGNVLRPQDPAYVVRQTIDEAKEATGLDKVEERLEELKGGEFDKAATALSRRIEDAAVARTLPGGLLLSAADQVGDIYTALSGEEAPQVFDDLNDAARSVLNVPRAVANVVRQPIPFQATRRYVPKGDMTPAALDHDDFVIRVVDAINKARGKGNEYEMVVEYAEEKSEQFGGEKVLGVHPAYATGMLTAVALPAGPGLRIISGLGVEAVRKSFDLLTASSLVKSLAARGAAREVLGQAVSAADAPSIKSIAASRAVNPAATALEMQAVGAEAITNGKRTIDAADLAERFGGNAQAARILDQAAKNTPGAGGDVAKIDARILQETARSYIMAGDAARVIRDLPGMSLEKARRVVSGIVDPSNRALVSTMTKEEMERTLKNMLKTAGHSPNTKTPFINGMYAMASRMQDDILSGVPVSDIIGRSIKGMGAKGALFQKNLLRTLVEEGRRAGKDVNDLLMKAARGKPSATKLKAMAEALGDGRGSFAVARAYRDTMTDSAKDALMQVLPEDYRFLSRTLLVAEDKWKQSHKALIDLMDSMYTITGTRGTGSVVTAKPGVELSELVSRVIQEVGPGVLQAGEGYVVAKGMLQKLRSGAPMTADELSVFTLAIQESLARDVPGVVQAVTEGAQTALAQGGVALRNRFYIDAATGLGLGQAQRGGRRGLMALKESANLVVEAADGSSAASALLANPDSFVGKNISRAASWVNERILKDASGFDYNPGTSVIAESYAREAQAAVAESASKVTNRLDELAEQGIIADDAVSVVVKEQAEEAAKAARTRFRRQVDSSSQQIDSTQPDAAQRLVAEAERVARSMMSNVTMVRGAESFRRGEGVIEAALRQSGFSGGLDALRQLPADEAIGRLEQAVVLAQKTQHHSESWVNLIKTIIPGKDTQRVVLEGGEGANQVSDELLARLPGLRDAMPVDSDIVPPVTLPIAIRAVVNDGGQVDVDGLLVPNGENLRRVMSVLTEAQGKRVYEHSLRYSDISLTSARQTKLQQAQDAWVIGTFSWMTHQQAGLDSAAVLGRMFDEFPELALDLTPGASNGAKGLQAVAVQSVLNDMMNAERMLTGKQPDVNRYTSALTNAYDRLNLGVTAGMSDLERAVFNLARYMETMDMSLTVENRVALATKLFQASQANLGRVPDVSMLVNATSDELLGRIPKTLNQLDPGEQMALKKHVTDLMARYEVSQPFESYLNNVAASAGQRVGRGVTKEYVTNAMINGVALGVDTSLLSPTYRALQTLWQRTGHLLGSGQFAAGIDTTVLISNINTVAGQSYSVPYSNAIKRLKAAVDSGRLQSNLDALSVKALKATGEAGKFDSPVGTAVSEVVQSASRTMNSSLLAGGGVPGFSFAPHPVYHARNLASVPEILIATIGAENAVKVARAASIGAASAQRRAASHTFRSRIVKAILPAVNENEVIIKSPIYGNITAKEFDEMVSVANIKFSRASIEAYESIGQQMAQAARMSLRTTVFRQAGTPARESVQFLRAFDPSGMNEWMKVAEDSDGITRRATFAAMLIDGRTIEDAALLARESLLDYGKVSASGSGLERFAQRHLLFWAFRRQSLITTINALADGRGGVFSRREILGRWIRLRQDQQKGSSPEEYLYGPSYKKGRGFNSAVTDDGYLMGSPSVISEGYGDLIRYMAIPNESLSDVFVGDIEEGGRDGVQLMLEALEDENFQPFITYLSKGAQAAGRGKDRGPVVPDVVVGQALAFQNATGAKVFDMMAEQFNWVAELDEDGVPVVTPGRPTLRRGSGRPYQLRFKTINDARYYDFIRLLQTAGGAARFGDEYFRIAVTMEAFVPEGYEARYRAQANTIAYIAGFETPARRTKKADERAKLKKQVEAKAQRVR